jgi:TfoX/Sxy family transcriptional regulator of competence genes
MAWKKSPARLVAAFDAALPSDASVERRTMFGYPCAFVNRNMFAGLHQDALFIRLDPAGRERMRSHHQARSFEPMPGRVMREYIVMPGTLLDDEPALARWVARAFRYAARLPAKRSSPAARRRRQAPARPRRRASRGS